MVVLCALVLANFDLSYTSITCEHELIVEPSASVALEALCLESSIRQLGQHCLFVDVVHFPFICGVIERTCMQSTLAGVISILDIMFSHVDGV